MPTEHLEKRFGVIAVEKGFITKEQFTEAFDIQVRESIEKRETKPIGEILVSLGYIADPQVIEVVKYQRNLKKP